MEEAQRSERRSARRTRNPLSDLTNAPLLSLPAGPLSKKPKPKPKPKPRPSPTPSTRPSDPGSTSSIGSSDPGIPASTPRGKDRSAGPDAVEHDKSKNSALSSRPPAGEDRKKKGKAVAGPAVMSSPPLEKTKRIGSISRMEGGSFVLPGAYSEPCRKTKKFKKIQRQRNRRAKDDNKEIFKHILPQDFIEKQKAYFAEIDAFELPEEVVSESDL